VSEHRLKLLSNYTESCFVAFNGRLRQRCLNKSWFLSMDDAREKVKTWRQEHNKERPYGALGNVSPSKYASATVKGV